MPKLLNYNGTEFANIAIGQGGFNYMNGTKIHLAGPVPSFAVTKLEEVAGNTRVYFSSPSLTFDNTDDIVLNIDGPTLNALEIDVNDFSGTHGVNYSGATYINTDHPWPGGATASFEPEGNIWTASYIDGAGSLFHTYPDIDQWPIVQIIARKLLGVTDVKLTNAYGEVLTIDGTGGGVLNVTGVTFPGNWVNIQVNENEIIAYRG